MGMYTEFVCKGKVKPQHAEMIKKISAGTEYTWEDAYKEFGAQFLEVYKDYSRADFIPGGWSAYHEPLGVLFNEESLLWEFKCSLKDYDCTIQQFVARVAPYLFDEVYECKSQYEEYEDDYWDVYEVAKI